MTYISETEIRAALSKKGWSQRDINSVWRYTPRSTSLEAALKTAKEWRGWHRRQQARSLWCIDPQGLNDDLKIDDNARVVEEKDGGAGYWVQAWVWVEDDEDDDDDEK